MKNTFKAMLVVVSFLLSGVSSAAEVSYFKTTTDCLQAVREGKAVEYSPTKENPFSPKKEKGWTKKSVPAGGACLSGADAGPYTQIVVYVGQGFSYWESDSGLYRMNQCSNKFGSIAFVGTERVSVVVQPQAAGQGSLIAVSQVQVAVASKPDQIKTVVAFQEGEGEKCDPLGNCRRTVKAGSMLCITKFNDVIVRQHFAPIGLTPDEAKKYCAADGDTYVAAHGGLSTSTVTNSSPVAAEKLANAQIPTYVTGPQHFASSAQQAPVNVIGQQHSASVTQRTAAELNCHGRDDNGKIFASSFQLTEAECNAYNAKVAEGLGLKLRR